MTIALKRALRTIGAHPALRDQMISACLAMEHMPAHHDARFRNEVTGPIVDALFEPSDILRKTIANGLVFELRYRSQIARDFLLSEPAIPDHVWEPQTTKLLLHLGRGARHVIFGGAYFGDQVILVAHALGSSGTCHAFEPDSDQREMLARNVALNGIRNVRLNETALWSPGVSRLQVVGSDALASTAEVDHDERGGVAATSIDAYLDAAGIDDVQVIALDVEGGELPILRGAEGRLSRPAGNAPDLVFEVHRSYVDWSEGLHNTDICRYLTSRGYTAFAVRDYQSNVDMSGRPIELIPPASAYLEGPPHGFNMVAVKDVTRLQGNLFRLRHGVSPKLLRHRDPALHQPCDDR
jgi:FkbM family methyltransferase